MKAFLFHLNTNIPQVWIVIHFFDPIQSIIDDLIAFEHPKLVTDANQSSFSITFTCDMGHSQISNKANTRDNLKSRNFSYIMSKKNCQDVVLKTSFSSTF